MKNFIIGFILGGLLLGTASAVVTDPKIVGGDGFLYGWDVVDEDGDTICSTPYVWKGTNEIACD